MRTADACPRERRLSLRMLARGEDGLAEALLALKGCVFGGRYRIESLFAVGGEGAVFLVSDQQSAAASGVTQADLVGKIALHPVHRPFDLDEEGVRNRRRGMRVEARLLETNGSAWMPASVGTFQCANASLPVSRGGAFAETEPVLVMERLPGHDLDRWIVRAHERRARPDLLRPVLDRIAIDLLRAVADLRRRGYHYADLRPGNVRILRRPERHIRLMDAGSLVPVVGDGRYPHVPAYLPRALFEATSAGQDITPDDHAIAVMAGRTLYEVATGERPFPGEDPDASLLDESPVAPAVAKTIAKLCAGSYADVATAAQDLADALGVPADAAPEQRASIREALRPTSAPAAKAKRGGWALDGFLADDVAGPASATAAGVPAAPLPPPSRVPDTRPQRALPAPTPGAPSGAASGAPMSQPVSDARASAEVRKSAPRGARPATQAPVVVAPVPSSTPSQSSKASPPRRVPAPAPSSSTAPRTAPAASPAGSTSLFAHMNGPAKPLPPPSVRITRPPRTWWRRLLGALRGKSGR